ncbi:hypothetical protein A3C89_01095 [Candidatus Kaiserbacteria bacterium RIFCSPHIGHO2_02_FULL_50_50]|uniref:Uncharacterized protein n=1 Tax=Candidatus Kaiserbacteria bacterium RIFCSPHIGHO2_02_FULL_50_50 TaxID=1798492 RepID=A0A1F6DDP1_9BACT|nr:MAG: hypothetical protein A3C89_01095 [Candidatus Kaiserbacteria bacterium RIFCSPHIGHO2_02_FULL_50_50]OGG88718.1 MAG: hypothetical protein A3G62_00495 [Candidatus Kaiserbacteria bacterium RIFCSPLOWO2_12_FULL_50_10]
MKCYNQRCWAKRIGYYAVMLAALVLALHGLGAILGMDLSLTGILGVSAVAEGWAHVLLGGVGLVAMVAHCRCRNCEAATGNMDTDDMSTGGMSMSMGHNSTKKCDNCMQCKGGCTHHER